jgi:hypothetical protein
MTHGDNLPLPPTPMLTPPLIDEQPANPFYCPELSAISYMDALRQRLQANLGPARDKLLYSFANVLVAGDNDSDILYPDRDDINYSCLDFSSQPSSVRRQLALPLGALGAGLSVKRKRSLSSCSFSDINGPPQHARSFQSVHDSSFEITIKHEKLNYSRPNPGHSPDDRVLPDRQKLKNNPTIHDLNLRIQALEGRCYHSQCFIVYLRFHRATVCVTLNVPACR